MERGIELDAKNIMFWSVSIASVGAGGSVAMYYQHIRMVDKSQRNKELQEKLNQDEFYRNQFEQAYSAYLEDGDHDRIALKRYSKQKRDILHKMESDGYKKSEIERIISSAEAKALIADYCK